MRLRLIDCRLSRLPAAILLCQDNIPEIAGYVNAAQQRLLYAKEASDESWYGTWAEVRLNVSRHLPYITLPREIARLEAVTVCNRPIPVNNQFMEYLQFGNGRMSHDWVNQCRRPIRAAYNRNNAVLFHDITNGPQKIVIYASNPLDTQGNFRVLLQGLDQNQQVVYTQDANGNNITGEFVTLAAPFATAQFNYTNMFGVQKDITKGPVQIFQMDPTTGEQLLLLTMEPGETVANYRRYFFNHLPCGCCPPPAVPPCTPVRCSAPWVTALVKLELIPVAVDTDYLLIQNLEAIIEEAQAVYYSKVQTVESQQLAAAHHQSAIRLLNGELGHYNGVNEPAVNFAPFGSAKLSHRRIGTFI